MNEWDADKWIDNMTRYVYLVVSSYFPTLEEPWRCSFVYDQVRAIQKLAPSYDVVVLKPNSREAYEFQGVKVVGFMAHTAGCWINPWLLNKINICKMWRALKDVNIYAGNIAVAHGFLVAMATYLDAIKRKNYQAKTILQFEDPDPYGMLFGNGFLGSVKKKLYFLYYRSLVEKMDQLVGISHNVSRVVLEAPRQTVYNAYAPMRRAMHVLRHFRSANVKSVYTLHHGVDCEIFKPAQRIVCPNQFVIGCVAVFRDWKDQLSLIRAIKILQGNIPGLCCKIVGVHHSGTMFSDCQRLIAEEGLPVTIIPSLAHSELAVFYRSLDLFVLPSYFEGFGCVFTESWCCGTPFITCAGQAMDDLIYSEDRCKWLCRPQDPEDLARKILRYYQCRDAQHLSGTVDIKKLVARFLKDCGIVNSEKHTLRKDGQ